MSADEKSRVKNLADDNFLTMEKQVWRSKKNKAMITMDSHVGNFPCNQMNMQLGE